MKKETLTRERIAKIVMGSYSNHLLVTILFGVLWVFLLLLFISAITLFAPQDEDVLWISVFIRTPYPLAMLAGLCAMTFLLINRTKRWMARKKEVPEGKHYELREVTLREARAMPKAFDKYDYVLYFDGCAAYDVPDENYAWSKEMRCNAETVYKHAKAGEPYYALIRNEKSLLLSVFPKKQFDIEPLEID